jgi:hypothetical protein
MEPNPAEDRGTSANASVNESVNASEPPEQDHFDAAINHVDSSYSSGVLAAKAAKGILYSVIETLGTLVGDPDLPEHARSGYQALLVSAEELRSRID